MISNLKYYLPFALATIIVTLLFSSCITEKKRSKICANCPNKIEIHDSITTIIQKVDTTIYITQQGETIYLTSPCDSFGRLKEFKPIVKKKNGIVTTLANNKGVLECDCKDDSLKVIIEGLNKIITKSRTSIEVKTINNKVNEITGWQKFLINSAKFFYAIVIIFVACVAFRFYLR